MTAYNDVQYSQYFSVTAPFQKGQYLGGGSPEDQCYEDGDHSGALNLSHWINVNNNWTWWNTGLEGVF